MIVVAKLAGDYGDYLLGGVMGDFLGATICMAELVVLSIILIQKPLSQFVVNTIESTRGIFEGTKDVETVYNFLIADPRIDVLLRFITIILITVLWCANVGHPDVFIRDAAIKATEAAGDDDPVRISLDTAQLSPPTQSQEKRSAEQICRNVESTFGERYHAICRYLDSLAKPVGSLGTLEDWAARIAALQRTVNPNVNSIVW
mmetsp:Transcript_17237/g.21498  ORF Transcript_17237/g.21498 Transcript_17237/m.21498 type:complete len:203 (+) Transcript_17237:1153-1761(+)